MIIDQITSASARRFPVAAIVSALRGTNAAVLVDGAHAPGIEPEPVSSLGADFWIGNLHKWTYAPRPTALLSIAAKWRERIRPVVVSWEHGLGFPTNVEWQGTLDYTPWLAAPTGVFLLRTLGVDLVRAHNAALAAYGQQVIAKALDRLDSVVDVQSAVDRLPMRVVQLPDGIGSDREAAFALRRKIADEVSTEVAVNPWPGGGLLRVSAQVYNRPEEYERLADRLPAVLRTF